MSGLQSLSNDLAAAVERAGRAVFGVSGRARLGRPACTGARAGRHRRPHGAGRRGGRHHGADGRTLTARVAGRDPTIDIAVLKLDAPDVAVADVADSDAVRVGHIVLALGAGPRRAGGGELDRGGTAGAQRGGRAAPPRSDALPGLLRRSAGRRARAGRRYHTSGASRHWQLAIPSRRESCGRRAAAPRPYSAAYWV